MDAFRLVGYVDARQPWESVHLSKRVASFWRGMVSFEERARLMKWMLGSCVSVSLYRTVQPCSTPVEVLTHRWTWPLLLALLLPWSLDHSTPSCWPRTERPLSACEVPAPSKGSPIPVVACLRSRRIFAANHRRTLPRRISWSRSQSDCTPCSFATGTVCLRDVTFDYTTIRTIVCSCYLTPWLIIESYSWYKLRSRFERKSKLQTYEISNQILNLISLNWTLINKSYMQCFDTLNTLN